MHFSAIFSAKNVIKFDQGKQEIWRDVEMNAYNLENSIEICTLHS